MTKRVQITMIGLGLLWCTQRAFGQPSGTQTGVQKEVFYKTSTVKIFAVDCGVVSHSPQKVVYGESDGVVLSESAKGLPCPTHLPVRIYPKEFETTAVNRGSSHMQVRNDEGLKEHLNKLLNGDYGKWFRTVEQ